jgi:hypothetical protein
LYHKKLAQDRQGGEIPLHVVERPLARTLGAEGEDYELIVPLGSNWQDFSR